MKIRTLDLLAYGHFVRRRLDLNTETDESSAGGLHLIYGENGAGKSTCLRAIHALLYGYKDSRDTHLFKKSDLRVRAHLELANSKDLKFVRRNRTSQPLYDWDDDSPIANESLFPFTDGTSLDDFKIRYALDHASLLEGGRKLVEGKGDLGEALFAAGLGGNRLANLRARLQEDIQSLYGDRKKNAKINRLLRDDDETQSQLKKSLLTKTQYDQHLRKLEESKGNVHVLRSRRDTLAKDRDNMLRLANCGRSLDAMTALDKKIDESKQDHHLDCNTENSLSALYEEWTARRLEAENAGKNSRDHKIRLENQEVDEGCLAERDTIESLRLNLKSFDRENEELKAIGLELSQCRGLFERAAENLGWTSDQAQQQALDDLIQLAAAFDERSNRRRQTQDLWRERHEAQSIAAQEQTASATALDEPREAILTANPRYKTLLEATVSGRGVLDEWLDAPLPLEQILRDHEDAFLALDRRAEKLSADAERREDERRQHQGTLDELPAPPRIFKPGADATSLIEASREQRDANWRALRDRLLQGQAPLKAEASEVCGGLEDNIKDADDLADARHQDQANALERNQLERKLLSLESESRAAQDSISSLSKDRQLVESAWTECYGDHPLQPATPSLMSAWIKSRQQLDLALDAELTHRREIADASTRDLRIEEAKLKTAAVERDEAESRWRQLLAGLGMSVESSEQSARKKTESLSELHQARRRRAPLDRKQQNLSTSVQDYAANARSLAERLALMESDPAVIVDLTKTRLDEARDQHSQRESLGAQLRRSQKTEQNAAASAKRLETQLDEKLKSLPADFAGMVASELPMHLAASRARRELEEKRDVEKRNFDELSMGKSRAELEAEAEKYAALNPRAEFLQLEKRCDEADGLLQAAEQELGRARAALEGEGDSRAAQLAAEREEIRSELITYSKRYLRSYLAERLLNEEVERFRAEHQGPLLKRASEIFARLTVGEYSRVDSDEDEKGKNIMVARTASGAIVGIDGLSAGTEDQLYFALRLASLEQLLESGEPMPFVADDLFASFDDRRTAAALEVLAELAKKTQVIVFTHHQSVVEAAKSLSPKISIHEHDIAELPLIADPEEEGEAARLVDASS